MNGNCIHDLILHFQHLSSNLILIVAELGFLLGVLVKKELPIWYIGKEYDKQAIEKEFD